MNKLLSCCYNMDTDRVEARFADGSAVAIDCTAIEDEYGNTPAQRAELDWLLYNKPLEYAQMVLSGEMERYLSWLRTRQIRGLTLHRSNNSPALVKKKPKRGCIDEGEMKGISGYRFSSNCSAVIVALPSAAKVMPSADWGV